MHLVTSNLSRFNLAQFLVIMFMCKVASLSLSHSQVVRDGKPVPSSLPRELAVIVGKASEPEKSPKPEKFPKPEKSPKSPKRGKEANWEINESAKAKLHSLFVKQSGGKEEISTMKAAKLFEQSKVNRKDIRNV